MCVWHSRFLFKTIKDISSRSFSFKLLVICCFPQLLSTSEGKGNIKTLAWRWENRRATCKRMKLEHSLTPYTKVSSKWIKDLKDTVKLLEDSRQDTLTSIRARSFWICHLQQWNTNKNKQMGPTELKSFYTAKETVNKMKRQSMDGEKISANNATNKGLLSKRYSSWNSMSKTNQPNKNVHKI